MHDNLILHHYEASPFAEKVRLLLGFKGLAWHSVRIPVVMPKPDLVALTGGYRKTPVLQIGADVYCDTALIARVLEARQPTPTLYPAGAPLAALLAQWFDGAFFWTAVTYATQPAAIPHLFAGLPMEQVKAFGVDRAPFSAHVPKPRPADARLLLTQVLAGVEAQLAQWADGPAWLFGAEPSIADFSLAHNLWFVRRAGPFGALIDEFPRVAAWHARVLGLGHGTMHKLSGGDAIAVAASAAGAGALAPTTVEPGQGNEPGQAVTVAATDYGTEPSAGTLVGLDAQEIVIERRDERAGLVHVHFPRAGYRISKADKA
jgi:glutathione S-transferase